MPLLFNLRRDPFEKAQHNSNTYNDWFLDRAFVLVPMQELAAKFLMTMKEYPPSQTPGSFNLEQDRGAAAVGRRLELTGRVDRIMSGRHPVSGDGPIFSTGDGATASAEFFCSTGRRRWFADKESGDETPSRWQCC